MAGVLREVKGEAGGITSGRQRWEQQPPAGTSILHRSDFLCPSAITGDSSQGFATKLLLSRVGVFLQSSCFSFEKRRREKQNISAAMLRADPTNPPPQGHHSVWSILVLGAVWAWPCWCPGDPGGHLQTPFLGMSCDGQRTHTPPHCRYQPQPLSRAQSGSASPHAAQHPHVAHPPAPGVPETPSDLGTR